MEMLPIDDTANIRIGIAASTMLPGCVVLRTTYNLRWRVAEEESRVVVNLETAYKLRDQLTEAIKTAKQLEEVHHG
jgi:hypothetical protein